MKCLNDVNYKNCVGKVCKSKSSGDFKIVKYNHARDVQIQFLNTGYETVAKLNHIKSGCIKDPYVQSVYAIGIIGTKYPVSEGGKDTKEYTLWKNMLKRCYSEVYKKQRPTYEGCEVSDNFKCYEYFYDWCQNQIGFNNKGWHLDKDLLIKGNKVYSENTSVFLPQEINNVLTKSASSRGEHLIGVCWHKRDKVFTAKVGKSKGKSEHLGSFNTEIEAYKAYKTAKEAFVKELANKWKDRIDPRAYQALMNYTVEIDD